MSPIDRFVNEMSISNGLKRKFSSFLHKNVLKYVNEQKFLFSLSYTLMEKVISPIFFG